MASLQTLQHVSSCLKDGPSLFLKDTVALDWTGFFFPLVIGGRCRATCSTLRASNPCSTLRASNPVHCTPCPLHHLHIPDGSGSHTYEADTHTPVEPQTRPWCVLGSFLFTAEQGSALFTSSHTVPSVPACLPLCRDPWLCSHSPSRNLQPQAQTNCWG